jgi:hypothetical protein
VAAATEVPAADQATATVKIAMMSLPIPPADPGDTTVTPMYRPG